MGARMGNHHRHRGSLPSRPPHVSSRSSQWAALWATALALCCSVWDAPLLAAGHPNGHRGWTAQTNMCGPPRRGQPKGLFAGKGGSGRNDPTAPVALLQRPFAVAVWGRHTLRALTLTRGGASSEETAEGKENDNDEDDPEWLHVTSVADVKPALSAEGERADAPAEEDAATTNETKKFNVSSFNVSDLVFGPSVDGDGSESDPDGLPARFLRMHKGNRPHAIQAFAHTCKWRTDHDVNTILSRPHPRFDLCKRIYESYFPGRDPASNPIIVSRPGLLDLDLAHSRNVSMDELLMHYVYILEWCWHILEPGPPDGVMTSVVDMSGVGMRQVYHSEMRTFIQRSVSVISENYPQRSYRTLIINAPRWFGGLFKIIKPLLRESTRKKIEILNAGPEQDVALRKYLGVESLPKILLSDNKGGGGVRGESDEPEPGPDSAIERDLRVFAMRVLEEYGVEMESI